MRLRIEVIFTAYIKYFWITCASSKCKKKKNVRSHGIKEVEPSFLIFYYRRIVL